MRNRTGRRKADGRSRKVWYSTLLLLQSVFVTLPVGAQGTPNGSPLIVRATPAANITRATRVEQSPVLDGRDDEAVWRDAPRIEDFKQVEPTEAGEPAFPTAARVVYDD